MRRFLGALVAAAAAVTVAEPMLGVHGHWPVGFSAALGLGGAVLLALSAKALGDAGLQRPDPGDGKDPET
jgi:hypothetical protein